MTHYQHNRIALTETLPGLHRPSPLLGSSFHDRGLFSLWFRVDSPINEVVSIINFATNGGGGNTKLGLMHFAGTLDMTFQASDGAIFTIDTPPVIAQGDYHHVVSSFDITLTAYHFYFDGAQLAVTPSNVGAWQLSAADGCGIPAPQDLDPGFSADITISDLYVGVEYLDLSDPSKLSRFINGGFPVDLGANGELPTGTPPLVYMGRDMDAADWDSGVNLGTGGAFTSAGGSVLVDAWPVEPPPAPDPNPRPMDYGFLKRSEHTSLYPGNLPGSIHYLAD